MGLCCGISKIARLCLDVCVMETISTDNDNRGLRGVTLVDNKLFVLQQRDANQVAVYSINDYGLLYHLDLPHFKPDSHSDLTSCVRYKCLYMSDSGNRCIHRYDLATSVTSKWKPPSAKPVGLSVTFSCNLLVTCRQPNKLVEMRATSGQCVREIALQSDIVRPWHGVQLTNGQFVVSHGSYGSLHRVCIVDGDGTVIRSYGGKCGSDADQLALPCHVAVDNDSHFIFVADCLNRNVTLLSPALEYVCCTSKGNTRPCRLHLDHATRRLYVGQSLDAELLIQIV